MTRATPRTYVTVALPYANGPLHLGHLVEMIEADVWVRAQRAQGCSVLFASGSDAHGTPIMIQAQKKKIAPSELVSSIHALHLQVIRTYGIALDLYGRTDSEMNKKWCYKIYDMLKDSGIFQEQTVEQFFDEKARMFLPDRFVKGTCPQCHSPDQNGDNCESCGSTYDPQELIAPYSILTKETPVMRSVSHLFVHLEPYREWLKEYLPGKISAKIIRKFKEWFDKPLRSWDITREAPYNGILIPDRPNQYFYVWFDAPIGYLALFDQICAMKNFSFEDFYHPQSQLVHFIGKDISYFHGIFWPVVLKAAKLPLPSQIHVHGFLTLNGEKMSKSRGIVCDPVTLAQNIPADCIRYYLASKMQASIDDMNFDIEECVEKINSDLVGKSLNILSRCAKLLFDHFEGQFSREAVDKSGLSVEFSLEIAHQYSKRQYQIVVQNIMKMMTLVNEDLTRAAPWTSLKLYPKNGEAWAVLTRSLVLFQELTTLLRPIIPSIADQILAHYGPEGLTKPYTILLNRLNKDTIKGALTMSTPERTPGTDALVSTKPSVAPLKPVISFDTFAQIDLRVGRVVECQVVEKSEKLLALKVDIGSQILQIFSGIKAYIKPEDLLGKDVVVCANLAPRKMSVGISEGMLLSIHDGENLLPLTSLKPVAPGSSIS